MFIIRAIVPLILMRDHITFFLRSIFNGDWDTNEKSSLRFTMLRKRVLQDLFHTSDSYLQEFRTHIPVMAIVKHVPLSDEEADESYRVSPLLHVIEAFVKHRDPGKHVFFGGVYFQRR